MSIPENIGSWVEVVQNGTCFLQKNFLLVKKKETMIISLVSLYNIWVRNFILFVDIHNIYFNDFEKKLNLEFFRVMNSQTIGIAS